LSELCISDLQDVSGHSSTPVITFTSHKITPCSQHSGIQSLANMIYEHPDVLDITLCNVVIKKEHDVDSLIFFGFQKILDHVVGKTM
jgi:hypothetical protein